VGSGGLGKGKLGEDSRRGTELKSTPSEGCKEPLVIDTTDVAKTAVTFIGIKSLNKDKMLIDFIS
jgi:hypothetical protein